MVVSVGTAIWVHEHMYTHVTYFRGSQRSERRSQADKFMNDHWFQGISAFQSISKWKLRKGVESLLEGQPLSRSLKNTAENPGAKSTKCQRSVNEVSTSLEYVFVPTMSEFSTGRPMSVLLSVSPFKLLRFPCVQWCNWTGCWGGPRGSNVWVPQVWSPPCCVSEN